MRVTQDDRKTPLTIPTLSLHSLRTVSNLHNALLLSLWTLGVHSVGISKAAGVTVVR